MISKYDESARSSKKNLYPNSMGTSESGRILARRIVVWVAIGPVFFNSALPAGATFAMKNSIALRAASSAGS